MDESIKTLIISYNNSALLNEFVGLVLSIIPLVIPIAGAMGLTFFTIKIFRRILNV